MREICEKYARTRQEDASGVILAELLQMVGVTGPKTLPHISSSSLYGPLRGPQFKFTAWKLDHKLEIWNSRVGQKGQFIYFITYEPNYPYRCYISSFMKIGWLIRKLRIGGGVGGNFFYFLGTAANLKGYWAFVITWESIDMFHFSTINHLGGVPGQRKCHWLIWNSGVGEGVNLFFCNLWAKLSL